MNAPTQISIPHQSLPDVIRSEDLFDGTSTITILHQGMSYTLRITRQGKLLLTK